jgi:hypothetical protein
LNIRRWLSIRSSSMSRSTFLQVTHKFNLSVLLPLPLKALNCIITPVVLFTTSRTANIVVYQTNVLSKSHDLPIVRSNGLTLLRHLRMMMMLLPLRIPTLLVSLWLSLVSNVTVLKMLVPLWWSLIVQWTKFTVLISQIVCVILNLLNFRFGGLCYGNVQTSFCERAGLLFGCFCDSFGISFSFTTSVYFWQNYEFPK